LTYVDGLHPGAVPGQQNQLLWLRVRHDDAHERLAGRPVPRVHRDRRERHVRATVHVLTQLPVHVRELVPEFDASLPEVPLHVDEAHAAGGAHVPLVTSRQRGQYQGVRASATVVRGRFRGFGGRGLRRDSGGGAQTLVQVHLDALVHHVPLPLHRSRAGHLAQHAHGHVQHIPRVRVVRLAQLSERLQLRVDVSPLGVHRFALHVAAAAPHELVGQFDARKIALDRPAAVRQVTAPGDRRQPLGAPVVRPDRVHDGRAQHGRAPVQARFPVVLPVRAPAAPRAVHVVAVVAHLVRAPCLGNGGRQLTLRVPATDRSGRTTRQRTRLMLLFWGRCCCRMCHSRRSVT